MYVVSNGIKTAVIVPQREPENPREAETNLGTMICWHNKYNLGDEHNFDDSQEFAEDLSKLVKDKEVYDYLVSGDCKHMRLIPSKEFEGEYDIQWRHDVRYPDRPEWETTGARFKDDEEHTFIPDKAGEYDREDILSFLTTGELFALINRSNEVLVLPLYLYEHSAIAMSTGSFVGRAHQAQWDSGCVGFIYIEKDKAIKEIGMAGDKVNVAMMLPENRREPILCKMKDGETRDQLLERNGFQSVSPSNVFHLDNPTYGPPDKTSCLNEESLNNGNVFKKDHTLYVCTGYDPELGVTFEPAATYNPDILHLTEENWKTRAAQVLEGEVKEFDSYLQGEVYGFIAYEGYEEVYSSWGHNACGTDIRTMYDDMADGWGGELRDKMRTVSYEPRDNFDIELFFEIRDFPGLRGSIRKEVEEHLHKQGDPFPYGMSYDDIIQNKDNVLTAIVESLYDEHLMPDDNKIREALQEHAGINRDFQPKISKADLEDGKEYTEEEVRAIFSKKPSLMDQIAGAKARQESLASPQEHAPQNKER